MRRLLAACLFWIVTAPGMAQGSSATTQALLQEIDYCLNIVERVRGLGDVDEPFSLTDTCPQLARQLRRTEHVTLLHRENSDSSLGELKDMRQLLRLSLLPQQSRGNLDYRGLNDLLKEIYVEKPPVQPSWWDRFWQRVFEWLKPYLPDPSGMDLEWLNAIPKWLPLLIAYGGMALIVLLALGIVINELRYLEGGGSARKRGKSAEAQATETSGLDLPAILQLPLTQRPAALLQFLLRTLMQKSVLPADRSYTNHEYANYLHSHQHQASSSFDEFIAKAELILYGGKVADETDAEQLLAALRTTMQQTEEKDQEFSA